ncbi:MAG TPA: hypothetical protein VMW60_01390 [Dehalococcoidales bacterium]|nr:hypothetical protein [Dehalococcoidales bacterium]
MPVIRDIPLNLDYSDEVLRRQGLGGRARVRTEIKKVITELLAEVGKDGLLEPTVAYECYPIAAIHPDRISLEGDKAIEGPLLSATFPEAREFIVLIATIGPRLEERVTEYSKGGKALRGVVLDGIGTAAVDMLIPEALRLIAAEVASRGYEISSPVNPGMPGFPMTEQWNLLELAPAKEIGVSLSSSGVLIPRKSTSMVVGTGPKMTRWTQAEVCGRCSLRKTCPYKAVS